MLKRLPLNSAWGLDGVSFFVANLQAAFGPFVSVYLTGEHWTQGEIGVALSIGTITAMVSQVPAGALVDSLVNKQRVATWSIAAIIASCLIMALAPLRLPVAVAEVLHGLASCTLNPAISAITLGVVATYIAKNPDKAMGALGARFGRNASFAAVGNALSAGLMGAAGYFVSARATFFLGAAMAAPGILALRMIEQPRIAPSENVAALAEGEPPQRARGASLMKLLREPGLFAFALCVVFFHLSSAAMLSLAAGQVTQQAGRSAELVIAACILAPQLLGAALSPWIGRWAETIGRRPIMVVTFAALPLRGALLSITTNPWAVVPIQMLDGISSAAFGVMLPLVAADLTRRSGHFNLCMGLLGLAMGLGASFSTTLAGLVADRSLPEAFLLLAGAGAVCVLLAALLMGETKLKTSAVDAEVSDQPDGRASEPL
ncbi:major facilitator superfamily transporter [Acetobacter nitrogenifigens DSM 23921 = NBRC 105050]|uniref:MFS transporter n=1 Tax=Acetobacter nitrogenifigens DSM 23921 = NBRC 105050 TaxID=1120919 RepID=A0A511XAB5_9PROT|nr:MFS transporter [Acetobacter nitrogenifigens]GBQ97502.1 major facilitator superfamily transporter [Acetobacter nitrogenifigens DSM 23921 = NBRC 105050]GEN59888.1 MFS transporter [Acetobacter nitrogenifigens DSM 23921 = NBRC 105050]